MAHDTAFRINLDRAAAAGRGKMPRIFVIIIRDRSGDILRSLPRASADMRRVFNGLTRITNLQNVLAQRLSPAR